MARRDDLRNVAIIAHVDFGGEAELGPTIVEGVLLLVDDVDRLGRVVA